MVTARRSGYVRGIMVVAIAVAALAIATLQVAGQAGGVSITLEPGVSPDVSGDFRTAVELTQQFWRETYNTTLNRQVRVLLVPNAAAYISTMVREFQISQSEGERRARTTTGWSSRLTIVINVERTPTVLRRFNLAGHELTHQYQNQITAPVNAWSLYWFPEGMADLIAWKIAEIGRVATVEDQRRSWLTGLRQAQVRPDLTLLDTEPKWFDALDVYGSANAYRVAVFAVEHLAETRGMAALTTYLMTLRDTRDRAQAFQRAFGMIPEQFSAEFKARLEEILR